MYIIACHTILLGERLYLGIVELPCRRPFNLRWMETLRIRNSTDSVASRGNPKASLFVKCDCRSSYKDCRPEPSVVFPWQRNRSHPVAPFCHPSCAVGRFGKPLQNS